MILKKFHSDFLYYFNILVVYFDLLKFVLLCKTSIFNFGVSKPAR